MDRDNGGGDAGNGVAGGGERDAGGIAVKGVSC